MPTSDAASSVVDTVKAQPSASDFLAQVIGSAGPVSVLVLAHSLRSPFLTHVGPLTFIGEDDGAALVSSPDYTLLRARIIHIGKVEQQLQDLVCLRRQFDFIYIDHPFDLDEVLIITRQLLRMTTSSSILAFCGAYPWNMSATASPDEHPWRGQMWIIGQLIETNDLHGFGVTVDVRPNGLLLFCGQRLPRDSDYQRRIRPLLATSDPVGIVDHVSPVSYRSALMLCLEAVARSRTTSKVKLVPFIEQLCDEPRVEQTLHRLKTPLVLDLSDSGVAHHLRSDVDRAICTHRTSSLRDAYIFGSHHFYAAFDLDGRILTCLADVEASLTWFERNRPTADLRIPEIHREGETWFLKLDELTKSTCRRIDGTAFLGNPVEPSNWGMWLLQGIPRIVDYKTRASSGRFLSSQVTVWQRALLDYFNIAQESRVLQMPWQLYRCDEALVTAYSDPNLTLPPQDVSLFRAIAEAAQPSTPSREQVRIYVSRRSVSMYRRLLNEHELAEGLIQLGFAVVFPEDLDFGSQVALFRSADVVVGLGGAGLFNVVFCKPGTLVLSIESSVSFVEGHANMFASLEHRYGFIFGQREGPNVHSAWTIRSREAVSFVRSAVIG